MAFISVRIDRAIKLMAMERASAKGIDLSRLIREYIVKYANGSGRPGVTRCVTQPSHKKNTESICISSSSVSVSSNTENQEKKEKNKQIHQFLQESFARFWSAYPRKAAKESAQKAWRKLNPQNDLVETIMVALEVHKQSEKWKKNNGEFITYPATWLNGRRWEDDLGNHTGTSAEVSGEAKPGPASEYRDALARRMRHL